MEIKKIESLGQTQTEEQKKQQREKITRLMLNSTQEAEKELIGASSCQHLFKYVSPIEQEIELQREEREKQEQLFRQSLEYQQWQRENHKHIRINEQVEAMRKFEAEKQQVNVDAGTGSNAGTEPKRKNQKRIKILNEWYRALCLNHQNDIEAINQEINGLTNEEIKTGLANITQANEKYLWVNGADRWIMDNGESVWKFERTKGGKKK